MLQLIVPYYIALLLTTPATQIVTLLFLESASIPPRSISVGVNIDACMLPYTLCIIRNPLLRLTSDRSPPQYSVVARRPDSGSDPNLPLAMPRGDTEK